MQTKHFKKWSTTSAQIRSEILHKAAEILSGQINDIASNLTIEQGKPIGEATGEVHAAVNAFRWASKEALNIKNITYPDSPDNYSQKTMFEPIGVVAGFSAVEFSSNAYSAENFQRDCCRMLHHHQTR